MRTDRVILWLNAVVFVGYGLAFLVAPAALAGLVTGSAPTTPSGLIDLRATYGGMSIAVGFFLALCAGAPHLHRVGVWAVAGVMLCMAGGRTLGMVIDGPANAMMVAYLALEVGVLALAAWRLSVPPP